MMHDINLIIYWFLCVVFSAAIIFAGVMVLVGFFFIIAEKLGFNV